MENNIVINEAYLQAIKYHQLQNKLEELGVGEVFKGGKKKDAIIKDALVKLAKIKDLKAKGLDDKEIELEISLSEAKNEEARQKLVAKESAEKKAKEEAALKQVSEKKYSKETLEKNLNRIDAALKTCVPAQRNILLVKREQIDRLLKGECEDEDKQVGKGEE